MPINLFLQALEAGITELARSKHLHDFAVQHKRNSKGELVIALIVRDKCWRCGRSA